MAPMVDIPIRVLIIEDTDDDKELVLRKLKKGGYIPEYECIQTREELVDALDNHPWDLILCDYSMPKFDGLAALKIVKQKALDIPFILISGTVGEEIAVEAMKAGAQDYMMKDNLIRLIPIIKRELAEVKIRKEKTLADEEIKNQNVVLDAIINNSHSMIIFMLDNEYRYVSFNENHRKEMKLVYDVDIEMEMNMLDLISIPEIKKKAKASIDKVLLGESFITTEYQPNTDTYYEMHWNTVLKDQKIIGASCFIFDITERKASELELIKTKERAEKNKERFELYINSTSDIVYTLDTQQKHTGVFGDWYKKAGLKKSDFLGKTPEEILGGNSRIHQENATQALKGESVVYEWESVDHDKVTYYQTSLSPIFLGDTVTGIIGIGRDISILKKTELELIKAKEQAEESDRLKSAFLANMSHEIRTPMNGILGFTDLLQNPDLKGEEQQRYIDIIQKSGDRMLNTVNDIIDISRIESGIVELAISEVNIPEQLNDLYLFFKLEAAKNGTQLICNQISEQDLNINTDPEKLTSILTNLIKNAIKYTSNGTIEMGYSLKRLSGENYVEFYVKDTGTGIEKNRQKAIFDRFVQADIEDKNAKQGSGLGLTISKAYTEMLGGKMWLESEVSKGSTFYFTIKYNTDTGGKVHVEEDDLVLKKDSSSENLKVLVVEDDEISDMLLSLMLQELNCQIIRAKNGVEAIEICRNNPDLDMVFMDIKMPVMGGYETTRQVRQFNKEVIVIAQSAYGLSGDKEKAIAAGCNDYITKPINQSELLLLVQKYSK